MLKSKQLDKLINRWRNVRWRWRVRNERSGEWSPDPIPEEISVGGNRNNCRDGSIVCNDALNTLPLKKPPASSQCNSTPSSPTSLTQKLMDKWPLQQSFRSDVVCSDGMRERDNGRRVDHSSKLTRVNGWRQNIWKFSGCAHAHQHR